VTPALSQSQRLSQRMSQLMQRAIGLLQLSNADLAGVLVEEAATNPALHVSLPMEAPDRPRRGWRLLGELAGREAFDGDAYTAQALGLYAHVEAQLGLLVETREDVALAHAFTAALEPSGWLGEEPTAIARKAGATPEQAEKVLLMLQRGVEPAGLFARSLAECLSLQLEERGVLDTPMRALLAHLPELARGAAPELCEICNVTPDRLGAMVRALRSLDPKPGSRFDSVPALRRAPDLLVSRDPAGRWHVALNRASTPEIVARPGTATDAEARATARWLVRTLGRRNEMVLRVAGHVVDHQRDFLEHGTRHLRPLSNAEVGAALGLHETTVGRIRADLLVQGPERVFELGSLFGRGRFARHGHEDLSGEAVGALIAELIHAEAPGAPLTDAQLAATLERRGIEIDRRSLSNWRKRAGFGPARERKKEKEE